MDDRCQTCKWWDPYDDAPEGVCDLTIVWKLKPDYPASLAHAESEDGELGKLVTNEAFGCVQHEPRDDANE